MSSQSLTDATTLITSNNFKPISSLSAMATPISTNFDRYGTQMVHAQIVKSGFGQYSVVQTAVLDAYSRYGVDIVLARKIFDEMSDRNVVSWTAMISGYTRVGEVGNAVLLFEEMPEGIRDTSFWNSIMLEKCINAYIYRNEFGLNLFLVNSLIDMYGKCGSLKIARMSEGVIGVFEEMLLHGNEVKSDGVTFIGLLNACTHGGLVEQGRHYYEMMIQEYRIEPQIEHYGCMVDLPGRAGQFEEAMAVVKGTRIPPDDILWGSLLNGCKTHRCTDLAKLAYKN
ncbi:Pentatricopeptide repeat-containing protein [Abeliophyllum distichum]|uniref:Pentatricopeptide repeat-containing protein n=1 Tax=Abeliophyllum distichum TaxID=126358 RepID=A0ABD1W0Z5_9LAMI